MNYYQLLRSLLKEKPHLRKCLAKCRHCQVLFFTHPRNASRNDLGCPFGCRQIHRRDSAVKRSIEFYKSTAGKIKKQNINNRRNDSRPKAEPTKPPENSYEFGIDTTIVSHIRVTTSLIEGRPVAFKEAIRIVAKLLRQLSFDSMKKMVYGNSRTQTKPP